MFSEEEKIILQKYRIDFTAILELKLKPFIFHNRKRIALHVKDLQSERYCLYHN